MSGKIVTLGLLKINVFWNKGYEVIVSFYDVTKIIISHDSNYIVHVVMWPKFGNSSISIITSLGHERSYHNLNFIKIWPEKTLFLSGGLGSSELIWGS